MKTQYIVQEHNETGWIDVRAGIALYRQAVMVCEDLKAKEPCKLYRVILRVESEVY